MNPEHAPFASDWPDAALAAALLAVDPGCGARLRSPAGPVRDHWLALLRELLPPSAPVRRIPLAVSDSRLLGGLDLAATLRAGQPVVERGLLAEASGGVVLLAMAERLASPVAARITAALDTGEVVLERDGLTRRTPVALGVVALDEGIDDETPPPALLDRLAYHLDLASIRVADMHVGWHDAAAVARARSLLPDVRASLHFVSALCEAAQALGIMSIRPPMFAVRAARAAAALDGRAEVTVDDATLAARLVLAPRATRLPASEVPQEGDDDARADAQANDVPDPAPADDGRDAAPHDARREESTRDVERSLDDVVLAAAQAAIPAGLLAQLQSGESARSRMHSVGRAGTSQQSALRGRPAGVGRGQPRAGAHLALVDTLRAAAPWQRLRRQAASAATGTRATRIEVRREDFHVVRFRQRTETTTIFLVDASGSAALHRLAEAKGAVELMLAECYVRRDRVAVLAFRGLGTDVLLPPTRSLVRAKRSLASLAGGGATPLASGIAAASLMSDAIRRRGGTPTIVLLTDGRANMPRDGRPDRERACADALTAARALRTDRINAILVDISPHAHPFAAQLAGEMGARYLALPHADARLLSAAVRSSSPMPRPGPRS